MNTKGKSPKHNGFFEKIQIKTVKFSSNVQVAVDIDGNLYCKYSNVWFVCLSFAGYISTKYPNHPMVQCVSSYIIQDGWQRVPDFRRIQDVAITNDIIYLIDGNGHLFELQYHFLPNKYDDPCVDKSLRLGMGAECKVMDVMERNIQNCKDHRRKKSFSSMPTSNYQKYLKDEYPWSSTAEFAEYLTTKYNDNQFELNDVNAEMFGERLVSIEANDYRVFARSDKGHVYVRGDNQRGACGATTELWVGEFTRIDPKYFDSPVIQIGMGEDHTLFRTELGRVFSCGADNLMQLGLGWTKRKCIKSDTNWTLLGQNGFAWTAKQFDRNIEVDDDKELEYFHEVPSYDERYPRVICGPFFDDYKVIDIDCGDYHCAVIVEPLYSLKNPLKRHHREVDSMDEQELADLKRELMHNRRVVTWGCGLNGQLGHANYANASEPVPVKPLEQYKEFNDEIGEIVKVKPIGIRCGKEHTVVLMEGYSEILGDDQQKVANRMVFAFGNNRYHQVSKKKKPKENQPYWIQSILPQKVTIDRIAAGNFQSAAFGYRDVPEYQY